MTDQTSVRDPRMLRAVAHPVRNRILTELSAHGSMRAADIARELDVPANQASFHLRQLAKYGLVEEDPDAARDRRDRVWKVSSDRGITINLSEIEKEPGGKAAVTVFRRQASAWAQVAVEQAYSGHREDDVHVSTADHAVRLTTEEAAELGEELDEVVQRWTERTRQASGDRRTYLVFRIVEPYPQEWGVFEDGR
jgi:DNA-binding transcriptional ArsR family regulator